MTTAIGLTDKMITDKIKNIVDKVLFEQADVPEDGSSEDRTFKPTTEWMKEKYDQINQECFGGELGECEFSLFTTGKGSQGKWLGYFSIGNKNVRYRRSDRHMYVKGHYGYYSWEDEQYINKENFVRLCHPLISINANYSGTEFAFELTLVHEMCHYYNYMRGYVPGRAHGREFMAAAQMVESNSGGKYTVEKCATAEEMSNKDLDPEIKARNEKRKANRIARVTIVTAFMRDGTIRMYPTTLNTEAILDKVKRYLNEPRFNNYKKVYVSTDNGLSQELCGNCRFKTVRDVFGRYYDITGKDYTVNLVENTPHETYYPQTSESIVARTISRFLKEEFGIGDDDVVEIPAGMNLGIMVPDEAV